MLNFSQGLGIFALAGLGAAAAPAIIHLLNRQRFRILHWAPIEFLRQAMLRSRKMFELRDVVLMLLRTAALLLFGLALSRPFLPPGYGAMSVLALLGGFFGVMCLAGAAVLGRPRPRIIALIIGLALVAIAGMAFLGDYFLRSGQSAQAQTTRQPVHVILLVDNSMSMGYRPTDVTLLDTAKARATTFVSDLPVGSRVTVIPLCGAPGGTMFDRDLSPADARKAIDEIRLVDRQANAQDAAALGDEAGRQLQDLEKRVILLSDLQRADWPMEAGLRWQQALKQEDSNQKAPELQIVPIGQDVDRENAWVASLEPQDRIADKDVPALITAIIRYERPLRRRKGQDAENAQDAENGQDSETDEAKKKVQVTLKVAGEPAETQTVELLPGQHRNVTFEHLFACDATPDRPVFVPISVSINPPDRLPQDDTRHLIVPVVTSLPVLFIDQLGQREDPQRGIYGETAHLRSLLAPKLSKEEKEEETPKLIEVRHMTLDRLAEQSRSALADVRLVVIAGVADPGATVQPLREYVEQGGQLFIAAGADFQPAAWSRAAWNDGAGILPAPLADVPIGKVLREAGDDVKYFRLNFESLIGNYFYLSEESSEYLRDLYGTCVFFKAVEALAGGDQETKLVAAETDRIARKLKFLIDSDESRQRWARKERAGALSAEEEAERQRDKEKRSEIQPRWLRWRSRGVVDPLDRRPEKNKKPEDLARKLAEATRPQVLARFTNGHPYAIERSVGLGSIVFLTSGAYGNWQTGWNTLSLEHSVILYDRILRSMLESTLPKRNQTIGGELVLPIDAEDRSDNFAMTCPDGASKELAFKVLEGNIYVLAIRDIAERGIYTVQRVAHSEGAAGKKPFVRQVAFNGPASESDLAVLDNEQMRQRMGKNARFRSVGKSEQLSLQGTRAGSRKLWTWLIWTVLLLLVVERIIVAWPRLTGAASREGQR